ncbi:MAG TPA: hypothetical protein VHA56_20220 [Mucilaginibacter sp.]|nr:hypothetical protein [Mucilaginibacter sp.]
MKKIFTTVALLCSFLVCLAFVGELTGSWTGTLHAPDGNDYPLNYTFKVAGDSLSGWGEGQSGKVNITNTKLSGNNFSFHIDINGVDVVDSCKFYPEGDTVAMDIDYQGFKMHATLKRAQ